MILRGIFCLLVGLIAAANSFAAATPGEAFRIAPTAAAFLDNHCASCHDADEHKGDVRLDNLESLSLDARLDLLNRVQEQVYFGEMPPKKKKQPTEAERNVLTEWIGKELRKHNASKLEDKLRMPEYGNIVNHGKLFSGAYKDVPGFTPDRRWLISEFIFEDKFNRLTGFTPSRDIDGKRVRVLGDSNRGRPNLTNPFSLPAHSGVRYYDTATLDGGHLLTMIANSKEMSAFMIKRAKQKEYLPSIYAIMGAEWTHENIISGREMYLNAEVEDLLAELYKERNQSLLPVFVATKPVQAVVDPKVRSGKTDFDSATESRDELLVMWAGVRKHSNKKGEDLILACERDWFNRGTNERTLFRRVTFMRTYMDDLLKRMPKDAPARLRPLAEPEMAEIRAAILKYRVAGDRCSQIIAKCVEGWKESFRQERLKAGGTSDEAVQLLIEQVFTLIMERPPAPEEKAEYFGLAKTWIPTLGNEGAFAKTIQAIMLRTDFVYRQEFGQGPADEHGRKMLSPRDASYAISYALTDSSPDKELAAAASSGRLNTREDYQREILRMLKNRSQYYLVQEEIAQTNYADSFTNMPIRKLRFFREFFGYPHMLTIFKDNKRFGNEYFQSARLLVSEADMLVGHILEGDSNVFEKLLTTEDFYVYHSGNDKAMAASAEQIRKIYDYFKDKDWKNFDLEKLKGHSAFLKEVPFRGVPVEALSKAPEHAEYALKQFKSSMASYSMRLDKGQTAAAPYPAFSSHDGTEASTRSGKALLSVCVTRFFNIDLANWSYPTTQPAKMEHRKGMLTHPAWLTAFSANTATDPVRRGKWIREKLLAGYIPDVPITVDAAIPEDHTKTLRDRLEGKTQDAYCWTCHERMNPLGNSFEMYDDFGRFRTEETLEHPDNLIKKVFDKGQPHENLSDIFKTLPVITTGHLDGTGDPALDGDFKDPIDLATRLGKSVRVRQSIIRHAFRYFLGRNEVLSDSKTLMDAEQAYVQSGGSFDAVIVSLLTSDSFIYRKSITN